MYFYNFYEKFNLNFIELIRLFYEEVTILENNKNIFNYDGEFIIIESKEHTSMLEINIKYAKDRTLIFKETINFKEDINNFMCRRKLKYDIKSTLYKFLVKIKGKSLSWGILTGIRPGIIVHDLLSEGLSEKNVISTMQDKYFLNNDKSRLIYDVAINERSIITKSDDKMISLYIGIPFCLSRCNYCSFVSHVCKEDDDLLKEYIESLKIELVQILILINKKKYTIETIYFGGGTPSILNIQLLEVLMNTLNNFIKLKDVIEITFEAGRPDSINREKLELLKEKNINRISINPQTMNDNTLIKIGREHKSYDIVEKFKLARKIGFDNINMDIIIGLADEGIYEVKKTFNVLEKLNPESITIHSLAIKRTANLKNEHRSESIPENFNIYDVFNFALNKAYKMDMIPYYLYRQKYSKGNLENIGFSKVDKKCIYNIKMIEDNQTIIGLGAGSVTKLLVKNNNKIQRFFNLKNVFEYNKRIDEMVNRKKKFIGNIFEI
ncbi:MAG: coproporphyrinogen dehydrogenase HemZ [Clostridiales bacterium]